MSADWSGNTALSARLRRFNVLVTLVGVVAIGGIGFLTLRTSIDFSTGATFAADPQYDYSPWENPNPVAAVQDGTTYSGRGQAHIDLTGLDIGVPLRLVYDDLGPIRFLRATGPDATALEGGDPALDLHRYGFEHFLIPGVEDLSLWVSGRGAEPWTLRVKPADLPERSGIVSGTTSSSFLYTGPATTARIVISGDGYYVSVNALTETGWSEVFSSTNGRSLSVAWADSSATVFGVAVHGDASWSIEFHEPEAGESEEPTDD